MITREIVMELLGASDSTDWLSLMRCTTSIDNESDTYFRMMIKKMPGTYTVVAIFTFTHTVNGMHTINSILGHSNLRNCYMHMKIF